MHRSSTLPPSTNGLADPARAAEPIGIESRVREAELLPRLVTLTQVAEAIGISRRSLERLESGGGVGPKRLLVGRLVRFRQSEIAAWIAAGCPPRSQWSWPAAKR